MTRDEALRAAKPILFNTDAVRAILDGRKAQTRRVIKGVYSEDDFVEINVNPDLAAVDKWGNEYPKAAKGTYATFDSEDREYPTFKAPYQKGDILYVRETWYYESSYEDVTEGVPDLPNGRYLGRYVYRASSPDYPVNVGVGQHGWQPSIHMPKEAARIFLRVTGVRVERVQDIDDDGVVAEGYEIGAPFEEIWDSTISKKDRATYGWDANPWVWVYDFERMEVETE